METLLRHTRSSFLSTSHLRMLNAHNAQRACVVFKACSDYTFSDFTITTQAFNNSIHFSFSISAST